MICPICQTTNDPSSQFCQKCGTSLRNNQISKAEARNILLLSTFKVLVSVFGLWLIKVILLDLDFVQEISIPKLPISVPTIIGLIILLVIFFLLFQYIGIVTSFWRSAFPLVKEADALFIALLWLILLGIAYKIIKPLVQMINFEISTNTAANVGNTSILILQLMFVLVALVLVFRAGLVIYYALPGWYVSIRESWKNHNLSNS